MDIKTSRQAIIVGCGRVGRRTAAQLAENGYTVTIIEQDEENWEEMPDYPLSRVVVGDGTDIDVFREANPTMADVVAGLTDDTETNLAVCELAQELIPEARTLLRISSDGEQDYAYLQHVDNIVYPAAAGASVATRQITTDTAAGMPPTEPL
jgi:trk system potassium uptake protein TrkA